MITVAQAANYDGGSVWLQALLIIVVVVPILITPMVGAWRTIGGGPALLFGLFLSWIGLLIVLCFPVKTQMRLCPYCDEEVKPTARICKHCGREIRRPETHPQRRVS